MSTLGIEILLVGVVVELCITNLILMRMCKALEGGQA